MDKENGEGAEAAGKPPAPDQLLDAAGLFGAYWGRDGGGGGSAAAQAQAQAQAALFGFGGRYPPPTTLGVAANQAASLGLHPAASAAWWSMASHLAAQDYLARLQASGLNFPPLADPYSALSALSAAGLKQPKTQQKQPGRNERSGRSSTSSSTSTKDKSPSTSTSNSQPNMSEWGSSYGFPKTSSPSTMHSQASLSSLASLNSLVSAPHQSKSSSKQPSAPSQSSRKPSSSSSSKGKERDLALLRGDLMLAQAAAHGAYHAAVAAAAKGKNMSPLYPFGMPGSDKDRHGGIDSLTGLPHTILSAALEGGDPSSVLGGVRLPPDTEIIKYTSSLAGPKVPPGSTNRGRKKTISLDPPQVSVHPSSADRSTPVPSKRQKVTISLDPPQVSVHPSSADRSTPVPSKRQKVDDYGNSRSSVEVIRLPNKPDRGNSLSGTPPPNLSDYAGISRELLQTIASQSGVSLAALERQLAGSASAADSGLNLSTKSNSDDTPLDLGLKQSMDEDAPLNLSLKPTPPTAHASDALSRLTSLSSSLNASGNDRISRRKPGAKPRRVVPELNSQVADLPRPKSSGSEDSESVPAWPTREGRPRNLGRGVSKPKKNTVASLLAQSRALGLRPALAQQLLGETDLEKLKALLGETASTDSECPSDSCPSDSDASDTSRRSNDAQLRLPLALGWKRVTVIKGLSRSCSIKGDVSYSPPEPHAAAAIKSMHELQANILEKQTTFVRPINGQKTCGAFAKIPKKQMTFARPINGQKTCWKRVTVIKGLSRSCSIKGDVSYSPPEPHAAAAIKSMHELQATRVAFAKILEKQTTFATLSLSGRDVRRFREDTGKTSWRVTVIKGLSRSCSIKGDVSYSPPEPHAAAAIKSMHELQAFLESNPCPALSADCFSFSARTVLGEYVQPAAELAEPLVFNEQEITKSERSTATSSGPWSLENVSAPTAVSPTSYVSADCFSFSARTVLGEYVQPAAELAEPLVFNEQEITKSERSTATSSGAWSLENVSAPTTISPTSYVSADCFSFSACTVLEEYVQPAAELAEPLVFNEQEITKRLEEARALAALAGPRPTPPPVDRRIELARRQQAARDARRDATHNAVDRSHDHMMLESPVSDQISHSEAVQRADGRRLEEERALAALAGPRPTPPPVDRRIELARRQQAARDARRDASLRSRDQARLVRELERNEKAEMAKREKEARSQQLLEAKRKKQEEIEKQKIEEQAKRQQERELKRQQAILLKEQNATSRVQQKYITEERERRRQHTTFIRQLDSRKRWEDKERRKHQNLLDRLLVKEKKLQQRRKEMELLAELRRPQEDSSLSDKKPLPTLARIPGLKLPGQAFADILQVYEFIHNFGQTLGFDVDNIPTLNTFQLALLPDCSVDAEEELVQVLTQLLVCAIEDPGIPHPGRHTTLLGHAIRMGDITPANLSEVLRIYLYANATGEIKALTGLTAERERERRVADHHQSDAEMQHACAHSKNAAYYEQLHANQTYKLSEALRDQPFLALNATTKAKILAFICNELLQNKAVLRQIDQSLENLNQLKKERYLMDMKIRKVRVLHQRKMRAEQTEKQQALALERMQRLVEESAATRSTSPPPTDEEQPPSEKSTPKKPDSPHPEDEKPPSPYKEPEESDKELSPLKDLSNNMKSKEILNNNKEECSPADNSKLDKDSVMGDCDAILSDLESEGTQPEEDEDKNLSSEELARKLEKLTRQSEQQLQSLAAGSHALRATCYGQDRYWRRYWSLGKCGGVFVEALESAQPETMAYHQALEAAQARARAPIAARRKKRGSWSLLKRVSKRGVSVEALESAQPETMAYHQALEAAQARARAPQAARRKKRVSKRGVSVEALESAQPETMAYHQALEAAQARARAPPAARRKKRGIRGVLVEALESAQPETMAYHQALEAAQARARPPQAARRKKRGRSPLMVAYRSHKKTQGHPKVANYRPEGSKSPKGQWSVLYSEIPYRVSKRGVSVEALESAQPETMAYHQALEAAQARARAPQAARRKKRVSKRGVSVEALESAQPETMAYHQALEAAQARARAPPAARRKKRGIRGVLVEALESAQPETMAYHQALEAAQARARPPQAARRKKRGRSPLMVAYRSHKKTQGHPKVANYRPEGSKSPKGQWSVLYSEIPYRVSKRGVSVEALESAQPETMAYHQALEAAQARARAPQAARRKKRVSKRGVSVEALESAQPETMAYHQALEAAQARARAPIAARRKKRGGWFNRVSKRGVSVEALESAQPETMAYHQALEAAQARARAPQAARRKKRGREKKEPAPSDAERLDSETEMLKEEALKSEMELKSIKSELNLSDHTQIIKYEPNVKHGACKVEGSSIKMEEKYIQQKQNNEEEDMLDIEDSIPTAFLVQKPTHKPMYAAQAEPVDKPQEIVKVENLVKKEETEPEEPKDQLVNNLEELRKMAEAVSSQLDAAKKAEAEVKDEKEPIEVKKEVMEPDSAHGHLYTRMLEGKWFSILRHESSFLNNINESDKADLPTYCDNEHTCAEVVLCQGHKWDVSNNLHLLNDPSLFTLNSMVTSVQVPSNNVYADSSLTMSGLDQDMMDASINKDVSMQEEAEEESKEQDNDLEKELQADAIKHDLATQKAKANSLTSLGLLNFNALSTYVTCDSPPPLQMSPDELQQLECCKKQGLPARVKGNFVPKELRHGWWRITDPDQLKELMDSLHPRGVRERELHAAFVQHLPTVNNKIYIDKGDILSTELTVSHLDRVIAHASGAPSPDAAGSYSASAARRVAMQLLLAVEQLEERVCAASMQTKGWRPSRLSPPSDASGAELVARARHRLAAVEAHIERRYLKPPLVQRYASIALQLVARARHRLAAVEAHIERRYLKPPLVQSTSEAAIGAALQGEHGNASAPSPQNSDSASETKETKGIARGLATWREAVARCNTSAQLAMLLQALESAVAWDKSIMKANCQFCLSGDNEDQLLLCDGCDKGYHTYCFKPRMDKIPEGDWYCWECVNKARGERVCIVCGGASSGRTIPCALCSRAYHQDCHYPPLGKNPRGKWYCSQCISRAPPKKPRNTKKRDSKQRDNSASLDLDQAMVPSPAPSHASTSTTAEECSASALHTPEKAECADKLDETLAEPENGLNHHPAPPDFDEGPPEKRRALQYVGGNGAIQHDDLEQHIDAEDQDTENVPLVSRAKKEKNTAKKLHKDLQFCKSLLCDMECHEHAWPFLIPVNTKQFPQYKKVIKCPMDLSTIKRKLQEGSYKCKEEFASDVRLIFSNCEVFNEDDSPVGRAGHNMRQFFEQRWQ
ncbi:uncharacterized protein LOC135084795 [Ostrinia nubilalis]|uniref:uncharacterized protein LOC135084795 n=1 Tax=Ostrinia nubilalis TaxID=29057 RepID=UPI0030826485